MKENLKIIRAKKTKDEEEENTIFEIISNSQYQQLLEQIEKGEVDINNYVTEVKIKLVKPERDYATEPWYDVENFWKDKERFPNLISIDIDNPKANIYEDPEYGERIYQYEQEREQEQQQIQTQLRAEHYTSKGITPPPLPTKEQKEGKASTKYYGPADWYPTPEHHETVNRTGTLDLSHQNIAGHLTIDGSMFPNLRILNVGNNRGLTNLTVRNCPKLVKLIYAYIGMDPGVYAKIEKCDNLKKENIFNEGCHGEHQWGEDGPTDSQLDESQKYSGNAAAQALLNQCSHLTWREILVRLAQMDVHQVSASLYGTIQKIATDKLETFILTLITKHLNQELTETEFLDEIAKLKHYLEQEQCVSAFTRNQLARLITLSHQYTPNSSYPSPVWPWLLMALGWITLAGLMILAVRKVRKKPLK